MTITTESFVPVNIGSVPNDGNGDELRTAFSKINQNFSNITVLGFNAGNIAVTNQLNASTVNVAGIVRATIANLTTINAGNITATGNITAARFVGDGSYLTNLPGLNGNLIINDIAIESVSNINLITDSGNSAYNWNFDIEGRLTLPSSSANVVFGLGESLIRAVPGSYPILFAGDTGGSGVGGPELNWADNVAGDNPFSNSSVTRNALWINATGFTVSIDANNSGPQLLFGTDGNLEVNNTFILGPTGTFWYANSQQHFGNLVIRDTVTGGQGANLTVSGTIQKKYEDTQNVATSSTSLTLAPGGDQMKFFRITGNISIGYNVPIVAGSQVEATVWNDSGSLAYINLPNAKTSKATGNIGIANQTYARLVFTAFGNDSGNVFVGVSAG